MIRFLTDENFNNDIVSGGRQRVPDAEFTRVQDTELAGKPDTLVLEWAAHHDFIVLSHDVNTMRGDFYDRMKAGLPVPGLFLIHGNYPIGAAIEELELIVLASEAADWIGEIRYLPL